MKKYSLQNQHIQKVIQVGQLEEVGNFGHLSVRPRVRERTLNVKHEANSLSSDVPQLLASSTFYINLLWSLLCLWHHFLSALCVCNSYFLSS